MLSQALRIDPASLEATTALLYDSLSDRDSAGSSTYSHVKRPGLLRAWKFQAPTLRQRLRCFAPGLLACKLKIREQPANQATQPCMATYRRLYEERSFLLSSRSHDLKHAATILIKAVSSTGPAMRLKCIHIGCSDSGWSGGEVKKRCGI